MESTNRANAWVAAETEFFAPSAPGTVGSVGERSATCHSLRGVTEGINQEKGSLRIPQIEPSMVHAVLGEQRTSVVAPQQRIGERKLSDGRGIVSPEGSSPTFAVMIPCYHGAGTRVAHRGSNETLSSRLWTL